MLRNSILLSNYRRAPADCMRNFKGSYIPPARSIIVGHVTIFRLEECFEESIKEYDRMNYT